MRTMVLPMLLLAGLLAVAPARAEDAPSAPSACDVPDYLLATESQLPKVAGAIRDHRALEILVIGSRSSTITSSEDSAYPARLQAMLKERFPATPVHVSVELQNKKSAEEAASGFVKLMEEKKPSLAIWQTGTIDAMRSIDPEEFRNAVTGGVAALQDAGADVILMNPQYSPRTETMISVSPYLDSLRVVAQDRDIPLFDRFAIMHQWQDQGDFDLFSPSHGSDLAKRVHDCLGRALTKFIVDAAHIDPAQKN